LFGIREADQIPIDPSLDVDRLLIANNGGTEEPSLP
jgi:hypothetical protein